MAKGKSMDGIRQSLKRRTKQKNFDNYQKKRKREDGKPI
jgi:hypothetical protein